jgi:Na+/proline symporter
MVLWGIVLGAFACLCIIWERSNASLAGQTLIEFALSVMTFAYAGLAAVFVAAIFTRRGNSVSAIAALMTGFLVVLLGQPAVFRAWSPWISWTMYTPTATRVWSLADESIAWPWVLTIAFGASLGVCLIGKRRPLPAPETGDRVEP